MNLYHGSSKSNIQRLLIQSNSNHPFGSAVYCSASKTTAKCYSRRIGQLYCVQTIDANERCINLDIPFLGQSDFVKVAILNTRKLLGLDVIFDRSENTRSIIHPSDIKRDQVNSLLKRHGVWMLFGHLDSYEHSGRKDDGVQYAIIDESAIIKVSTSAINNLEST